jgi:hypothetical protein
MIRDTASNPAFVTLSATDAALSATEFCKVQFERYLDSLGFTRKVRWIEGGDANAPAFYLELDGQQYAVEVTTLNEQVSAISAQAGTGQSALTRFASPLMDMLGEANSMGGVGALRKLAHTLRLEKPLARLRKYQAKMKEALYVLNTHLGEKREKLRDVSLPKIVLVYDAYRSLEQEVVERCLGNVSSLSSFQMVFITNWDRESYVVYP